MRISHPTPTDHNPKGAVPHTRHSPLLLYAHQHTARAPRPPERSPPEGKPPNGDKHSEACRQLGTYVEQLGTYNEQLGTYDEQLGTWKIPSAELFLRSGEQSRAMRARKYRTPSVYRKFKGGHNEIFKERAQRNVQQAETTQRSKAGWKPRPPSPGASGPHVVKPVAKPI